jgi:hypothetical protein
VAYEHSNILDRLRLLTAFYGSDVITLDEFFVVVDNNNNTNTANKAGDTIQYDTNGDRTTGTTVLAVHCVYTVLTDTNQLDKRRIAAQHEYLSDCLHATNVEQLAKTPYWFEDGGDPEIELTYSILETRMIPINSGTSFSSLSSVLRFSDGAIGSDQTVLPHVINIYVAPLSGGLLGEAMIDGNVMVIDTGTLGSPGVPGTGNSKYSGGATAVHEIGHVFGLPHTFDNPSTCTRTFADVPSQVEPNEIAALIYDSSTDRWDITNDNRERDCLTGTTTSCVTSLKLDCDAEPFEHECAFCYMDYSDDDTMLLFSIAQSEAMRRSVLTNPLITVIISGLATHNKNEIPLWSQITTVVMVIVVLVFLVLSVTFFRKKI